LPSTQLLNHRPEHRVHLDDALHKPVEVRAPLGFVFNRAAQSSGDNLASIGQSALLFVRRVVRYLAIQFTLWADHCVAGFGPFLGHTSQLADPMLGGHQLQIGQTQRIGQRVEVVFFGQPRPEVVGLVLPGFAQRDAFEFAEGLFQVQLLCNNLSTDWGFSVGIGLRRLSGAFVFVLTEIPLNPSLQIGL
jgi:hypothetical protein